MNKYMFSTLFRQKTQIKDEQGSALVTALIMISMLTIITGTIMAVLSLQYRFVKRDVNRMQAMYLAEAGLQKALWLLSGHGGRDKNWRPRQALLPLFDSEQGNVTIKEWGGYLEIISTASYKRQTITLTSLIGEKMPSAFSQAIVVGGVDYPLVVTGDNRITGDVTVGSGGVKAGRIKGKGFSGSELVNGKITVQTSPKMPYYDASLLKKSMTKYQDLLKNPAGLELFSTQVFDQENPLNFTEDSVIYIHGDVIFNANASEEKFVVTRSGTLIATGKITIENGVNFKKRILLISGDSLEVRNNVVANENIFYAEKGVFVSGNFYGSIQVFSPADIQVAEKAQLIYPSLLFSTGKIVKNRIDSKIEIIDQASIQGTVIFQRQNDLNKSAVKNYGKILLSEDATVSGAIYSSNNAVINGKVNGIVITSKFYFYQSPTTYINWLKDAVIDRTKLNNEFLLPLSFETRPKFGILSWEVVNSLYPRAVQF